MRHTPKSIALQGGKSGKMMTNHQNLVTQFSDKPRYFSGLAAAVQAAKALDLQDFFSRRLGCLVLPRSVWGFSNGLVGQYVSFYAIHGGNNWLHYNDLIFIQYLIYIYLYTL